MSKEVEHAVVVLHNERFDLMENGKSVYSEIHKNDKDAAIAYINYIKALVHSMKTKKVHIKISRY